MTLVEYLLAHRSPLELAKELAQHAKERAVLLDRVDALEHELFWVRAREHEEITALKKTIEAQQEEMDDWASLSGGNE